MIYIIFLFYFYSKQEPITFLSYFNKQINESRTGYERNPGNPNEKLFKKTGMIFSADRTFLHRPLRNSPLGETLETNTSTQPWRGGLGMIPEEVLCNFRFSLRWKMQSFHLLVCFKFRWCIRGKRNNFRRQVNRENNNLIQCYLKCNFSCLCGRACADIWNQERRLITFGKFTLFCDSEM